MSRSGGGRIGRSRTGYRNHHPPRIAAAGHPLRDLGETAGRSRRTQRRKDQAEERRRTRRTIENRILAALPRPLQRWIRQGRLFEEQLIATFDHPHLYHQHPGRAHRSINSIKGGSIATGGGAGDDRNAAARLIPRPHMVRTRPHPPPGR